MNALVEALAHLSSLRDRESLDFSLVTLLRSFVAEPTQTVSLLRLVGESGDQRWQTQASLKDGSTAPTRDRVWVNFNTLPRAHDYRDRQACVLEGEIQQEAGTACFTQFPVQSSGRIDSILEVESNSPLSKATREMVTSILKIYRNVQGLLDYGERDALTDLLNRKSFDNAFLRAVVEQDTDLDPEQANRRHEQAQGSYWLTMIDIDHFKRVNDNYGHLIGDEVLLLLARLMRATFRFHDQLYRFGGEEFVVLLRCADHADVSAVLERFRRKVEEFSFPQVGTITVSVGFTELRLNDMPGVAFDRADKAVYYAKAHGRNQVCSYAELVTAGELTEQVESTNDVSFF